MAETKEIYVKVTIDEKGEITVNASIEKAHALKLLNEGITVCVDAIIEDQKREQVIKKDLATEAEAKILETE